MSDAATGLGSSREKAAVYRNVQACVAGVAFFALMLLIGVLLVTDGLPSDRAFGFGLSGISVVAIVRSCQAPSVVVSSSFVRARFTWRTRTWQLDEVESAATEVGVTGLYAGQRRYLVLVLRSGERVLFKEMNASRRSTDSALDRAVESINRQASG